VKSSFEGKGREKSRLIRALVIPGKTNEEKDTRGGAMLGRSGAKKKSGERRPT